MKDLEIYPQEWLQEKLVKISRTVMVLDETNKSVLYRQSARKDFDSTIEYVKNKHHPFNEITYLFRVKDEHGNYHDLLADVKNNRSGNVQCVMRLFDGGTTLGWTAFTDTQQILSPTSENTSEYDYNRLRQAGRYVKRMNELVGCFAITRRNNKVSRKTGVVKSFSNITPITSKPRTIRLQDISELQLSTYIEGSGSKPSYEFGVRGHIRHYKNGKEVFIKPYIKCKGRGKHPAQFYKINQLEKEETTDD